MSELARILWSLRPVLRVRTVEGEPLAVGEHRLVPVARTMVLGLGCPGGLAAGWARARPLALLDTYRGETRRIPIPDPTRRAIMAMAGAALLLALAARCARSRSRRAP
ncbi:MAG TPA: hypothetical protein PLB78_03765 [Anaerolineae bacterium]|nr:hypothetical protein [Anaerolineae bacterium]